MIGRAGDIFHAPRRFSRSLNRGTQEGFEPEHKRALAKSRREDAVFSIRRKIASSGRTRTYNPSVESSGNLPEGVSPLPREIWENLPFLTHGGLRQLIQISLQVRITVCTDDR